MHTQHRLTCFAGNDGDDVYALLSSCRKNKRCFDMSKFFVERRFILVTVFNNRFKKTCINEITDTPGGKKKKYLDL